MFAREGDWREAEHRLELELGQYCLYRFTAKLTIILSMWQTTRLFARAHPTHTHNNHHDDGVQAIYRGQGQGGGRTILLHRVESLLGRVEQVAFVLRLRDHV